VAVHGRDKYLNLLACGGVALGSQEETSAASNWRRDGSTCIASKQQLQDRIMADGAEARRPHWTHKLDRAV